MLKIEVFGAGCPKCKKTEELFMRALSEMNVAADLSHVKDMNEMIKRGVMFTPAVFINDKKVLEGRVPTAQEVEKLIKEAQ
ncbi:thioredoxin family protein [bacterium]|nr:thioredoxin family protein [bacterium]